MEVGFLCSEKQSLKNSALVAYTSFGIQKLIGCFAARNTASTHTVTRGDQGVSSSLQLGSPRGDERSLGKLHKHELNLHPSQPGGTLGCLG